MHVRYLQAGWLLAALALLAAPAAAEESSSPAASQPDSQPSSQPSTAPASQSAAADAALQNELEQALAADKKRGEESVKAKPAAPLLSQVGSALQSMNPDLALIADVAAAYFSSDDPPMAGEHDPKKTGLTLQQLELSATAAVDHYFRFDANIVFSQFGVEIEEVYATTLALPWNLQLRAGQFLNRFGRINNSHPHSWKFTDQNLLIGKFFGGEGFRGLGAELSLLLPLPWYLELIGSVSNASGESTSRSFIGGEDYHVGGMEDFAYMLAAKQFHPLSQNWSLSWGLSAALGPNATGRDNRTDIFGVDLYLKYRPITRASYTEVSLEAEWMLRRRQVPARLLQDHGLLTTLFWRFARRWATAARYELVSGVDQDPLDPQWSQARHRVSGALTFWPTEFSRVRLQYNHDIPGWQPAFHVLMLSLEFSVGAHGAHPF